MKIAHLVSPVAPGDRPDLESIQALTFDSLRRARDAAPLPVELLAAGFGEAPPGFRSAPLERSVLDHGAFAVPRKLPLLADLVHHLRAAGAQLCVLTNADIIVAPDFYARVLELWRGHRRAFSINRRTVKAPNDVSLEWLLAQPGQPHPGHDCFVFEPALLDGVDLGALCLGFPPVGAALVAALSTRAAGFAVLDRERLTFHLGDDRLWRDPRFDDYWAHNRAETAELLSRLAQDGPLSSFAEEVRRDVLTIPHLIDF